MIKFEHTEVLGWEAAIRGMRNPMNSWDKSDSKSNIITLCGSSKFKNEFLKVQKELSLKGYLVLSLGLFGHSGDDEAWVKKDLLDRVHKQKIDMSSAIFVIDVDVYVGESTKNEIEYAINRGKTVYFYSHDDLEAVQEISNSSLIGSNDLDLMKRLRNAGTDHRKFMRMIVVYADLTAPMYWWSEYDTYKIGTVANSTSKMHKMLAKPFEMNDFSFDKLPGWKNEVGQYIPDFDYDKEIWKEIGKTGYEVSDLGRTDEQREEIKTLWNSGKHSRREIARMYGVSHTCINDILNDKYRYATKVNVFETVARPIVDTLNELRDTWIRETDETKKKQIWYAILQLLPVSYNQRRTVMLNYEVLANIYKSRKDHKLDEWREFCEWIEGLPYSEIITGKECEV